VAGPAARVRAVADGVGVAPETRRCHTHSSPLRGLTHGKGGLGRRGYSGPLPVRSHGPHSYVFQLFALDLPDNFTLDDTIHAITGHVIARARLDGTYEIR
jgi:phosphatidylethanolamine-binding protein (PEBP) family uncharacterized protein